MSNEAEEQSQEVRPYVLVSNDDGYSSRGLRALVTGLSSWANVVVVAPETEQSASSHALSLHRPLRARLVESASVELKVKVFAIDGTPADCVYAALHANDRFLSRWPDIVCSGINRGMNLGQDAFYSGTIAAAREGALRGIPALAASGHAKAEKEELARFGELVSKIAKGLFDETRGKVSVRPGISVARNTPLLNLNIPPHWNGSVRHTRLGARLYEEVMDIRSDPRGREYMWLGGPGVRHEKDPGSDTDAYDEGVASLTSLLLDLTRAEDGGLATRLVTSMAAAKS